MWKVQNSKNRDCFRFDDASTARDFFDILKRDGYSGMLIAPCGTVVNSC
jgi:hypothetical protein